MVMGDRTAGSGIPPAGLPSRRAFVFTLAQTAVVLAGVGWLAGSTRRGSEAEHLVELAVGVCGAAALALLGMALWRLGRLEPAPVTAMLAGAMATLSVAALAHVIVDGDHLTDATTERMAAIAAVLVAAHWGTSAAVLLAVLWLRRLHERRVRVGSTILVLGAALVASLLSPLPADPAHGFLPATPWQAAAGVVLFGAGALVVERRRRAATDAAEPLESVLFVLCVGLASTSAAGLAVTVATGSKELGHIAALAELCAALCLVVPRVERLTSAVLARQRAEVEEATTIASSTVAERDTLRKGTQELRHDGYATLTAMQSVVTSARNAIRAGDPTRADELLGVVDEEFYRLRRLLRPSAYVGRTYAVADVLSRVEVMYASRGLDIRSLADRSLRMDGDPDVLMRALANLVQNIIDHAPNARARLLAYRDTAGVVVEVVDDGPGIDPRMRSVVLERGVSTKLVDGSGVGLSAVADLLAPLNGSLHLADGEGGHGLRVILHLPDDATPAPCLSPAGNSAPVEAPQPPNALHQPMAGTA
jgi:two-component system sensor histidine kinase QseC